MKRSVSIVILILFIWFVISFVTNMLGSIIPNIKEDFQLSNTLVSFIPLSFFIAYGFSILAGIMNEKYGEKSVMIVAFSLTFVGSFLFALFPQFGVALISLFTIGIGMALLQVAINPLMRTVGGEENFAFNSVLGQLSFGSASFISPIVYSYFVTNLSNEDNSNLLLDLLANLTPENLPWVSLYWVFAVVLFAMVLLIIAIRLPKVELKEDEKSAHKSVYLELLKDRKVILYFFGIFAYVGTEQGIANWISEYLKTYYDLRPEVEGAAAVSWFWGLMTAGCILGLLLLKLIDSKIILKIFSILSMGCLLTALFGSQEIACVAFPLTGFFISVMFSIIFSLALNSVPKHQGAFAGILCTGIIGGAIMPLIVGRIGDIVGLRRRILFLLIPLIYILSISFWSKPLIKTKQ